MVLCKVLKQKAKENRGKILLGIGAYVAIMQMYKQNVQIRYLCTKCYMLEKDICAINTKADLATANIDSLGDIVTRLSR